MRNAWITLLLFFTSASGFGQVNVMLQDGYYLGSASTSRSGALLVAQAHREGYDSVLILKKDSQTRAEVPITDLRINAVRWLDGPNQRFYVGGSTGHARFSRIYRFDREMNLVKEWDSVHLPEDYQAADLSVSDDGVLWTASFFHQDSAKVVVGSTEGYESHWDWTVTVSDEKGLGDPLHSGSVVLDSHPQRPAIALLWRGMVQVLTQGQSARQLLADARFQVLGLYFQAETEILWGTASLGRLVGFRLAGLENMPPGKPLRAAFQIEPQDLGIKGVLDLKSLEDGRMLLHAQLDSGHALVSFETQAPNRLEPKELTTLEPGGRFAGWGVLEPSARNNSGLEFELKSLPIHRNPLSTSR